ncbi:MAG TPA: FHA domain-containing protein [Polyangiaceae bacterium]|nr:FHA domain-containing protein [Polyangiaceae bacterium]
MNPFGATVSPTAGGPPGYGAQPQPVPSAGYGAPSGYGAPPAPYAPPPPAAYAPPAYVAPPPAPAAPAGYQAPPPAPVQPAWTAAGSGAAAPIAVSTQSRPSAPSGPHSHDPSAFAATSPPSTSDEHEAQIRRSQAPIGHSPSAPPARSAPPPPMAPAVGPGRDPELVEAGAIRVLAGFLVSYDQSELGVFWPLYQGQNVLGRKGASAGLDIEIDSPTTSSRHGVVYASARPGRLKVEDVGSTNGTFLNEAPIERGKKFELRDNDTLRFGGFSVTVKII